MKPVHAALIILTMPLAGCFGKDKAAPTGQVVATIDGEEITAAELKMELGGVSSTDPATMRRLKTMALQNIVNRHILTAEAKKRGLDGTPTAEMVKQKATQLALVDLLQQKMRTAVPLPSKEEAQQFVSEHPASFSERRIFLVDQIVLGAAPSDILAALEPIDTMEGVQALLSKRGVSYSKAVGVIDALSIDADAAEKIVALPAGAVFINRDGGPIRVNRIREVQTEPIASAASIQIAQEKLASLRTGAQLKAEVDTILKAGMDKVRYNAAYMPVPIPKGAVEPAN